jgi:MarR family transcriptional regulator for hemolysin
MASIVQQPALEYDFEASIGYWIVLSSQAFQKALNDELAPHGITYRQSQVLGWLALEGELSQVELAARMMIEPATLVRVLDRMERDQWISRSTTSADRRRKVIRANAQATVVWGKVAACARRVRAHAAQGLSERQLNQLKKTLKIVLDNLRDYEPQRAKTAEIGEAE